MKEIRGTGVALITPFRADQSVDYDALEQIINFQIENGVDYLVSLGTTGETATLSKEEKQKVWQFTADTVKNRVPLVAGIGGNNTLAVAQEIKTFNIKGYIAILSVSPYYNKPTQEGLYEHYKYLSKSSPLPLILYNVPGRTGSNLNADTCIRLAKDCKNIVAVKEASGDLEQISKILRDAPVGFQVISGNDSDTVSMIALGAVGVISVLGNALPKELNKLVNSALSGDFSIARKQHKKIIQLIDLCFVEGNPAGVKNMLHHKNICLEKLRLPLTPVSKNTSEAIAMAIQALEK